MGARPSILEISLFFSNIIKFPCRGGTLPDPDDRPTRPSPPHPPIASSKPVRLRNPELQCPKSARAIFISHKMQLHPELSKAHPARYESMIRCELKTQKPNMSMENRET